ncbi:lactonase family protein [Pseudomonas aeruginosa]|jgi:6-phosphogluconolactonase (cycloisomerase 2 family)|uniref:lactonase family protein n=1 Tax=Pseudomonas aeruginosa TaxID=287 RepID=UPI001F549D94|nr:lactonase family protein [Pseudomonas aeruginosa]MCU9211712.1 lactonase family protein [Pseudomonas aeruginosa]
MCPSPFLPAITRRTLLSSTSIVAAATILGLGAGAADAKSGPEKNPMQPANSNKTQIVYVGSRTTRERNARGAGITVYRHDPQTGRSELVQTVGDLTNPSFLCLDQTQSLLFCVHGDQSTVSSFQIEPASGTLTKVSSVSCEGNNPVHLTVDKSNKFLAVANYATGSIVILPFDKTGHLQPVISKYDLPGNPGPHKIEQASSHPHMIPRDPSGRFLVVPDKGLDKVFVFDLKQDGTALKPELAHEIKAREGAGPRHVVFSPTGSFAYVVNELDSTITSYRYNQKDGSLVPFQMVPALPQDFVGDSRAAALVMAPNGEHLFSSNRGHDSVTIYSVDQPTGKINPIGNVPSQGKKPRFMTASPNGRFLFVANEDSDNIKTFSISPKGELALLEHQIETGSPVCMIFRTA